MKAAVVNDFGRPPQYLDFEPPTAQAGETLVRVRAAALSQLVRAQASGRHYSSPETLPAVPGSDGVGTLPDGQRVYFAFPRAPYGSMAEISAVRRDYCVPLPEGLEDVTAAALANPGMSSWAALSRRAHLQPGETVLINGGAGASGQLAIQVARALGAGKIIVTGRNQAVLESLRALGADVLISLADLGDDPASRAELTRTLAAVVAECPVDVILDYLWGPSAECLIAALALGHDHSAASTRVRFVQIGNLSGANISLPASVLRSTGLELLGSGLGSVSQVQLVAVVGELLQAAQAGHFGIAAQALPLSEVESAWPRAEAQRLVFIP